MLINTRVFILTRYVFMLFVYTFYNNILGNKIDLELPSGLAWWKFMNLYHATFDIELVIDR